MRAIVSACFACVLAVCNAPFARAAAPEEGINYLQIDIQGHPGKHLEVVELFWYRCPYCYRLEPRIESWRKTLDKGVSFRQQPAVVRPSWRFHARAFYTAKALGVLDRFHTAFFDAIHRQHQRLASEDDLTGLFAGLGVAPADFHKAFNSSATAQEVDEAERLTQAYGVVGTPAFVVGGRYLTDARMAGGLSKLLHTVDFLIELARQEHGSGAD